MRYGSQEAMKIRRVDEVWICDQQVSDAKVREIVGDDRTDAAGADDADLGVFYKSLASVAEEPSLSVVDGIVAPVC